MGFNQPHTEKQLNPLLRTLSLSLYCIVYLHIYPSIYTLIMASSRGGCDGGFACTYMLLKPEEVRLFDLVQILFSPKLNETKFVDSPDVSFSYELRQRWLIFMSILVQKILQSVAKPIASFGSFVEMWLNLVSSNHNVFNLLLNFLTGLFISGYSFY